MWRKSVKWAAIVLAWLTLWLLLVPRTYGVPLTRDSLAWVLLSLATAVLGAGPGGAVGGMLGFGYAVGRDIGISRRECARRGALLGVAFGVGPAVRALGGNGPGTLFAIFLSSLFTGLIFGFSGLFITRAEAAYALALHHRAKGGDAKAVRYLVDYLARAREDPGAARRVREADQLLREIGREPEATEDSQP